MKHLDRHHPIELQLPALVDHAGAAGAQPRHHFIASAQRPADERIRYGRRWELVYAHRPFTIPSGTAAAAPVARRSPAGCLGETHERFVRWEVEDEEIVVDVGAPREPGLWRA